MFNTPKTIDIISKVDFNKDNFYFKHSCLSVKDIMSELRHTKKQYYILNQRSSKFKNLFELTHLSTKELLKRIKKEQITIIPEYLKCVLEHFILQYNAKVYYDYLKQNSKSYNFGIEYHGHNIYFVASSGFIKKSYDCNSNFYSVWVWNKELQTIDKHEFFVNIDTMYSSICDEIPYKDLYSMNEHMSNEIYINDYLVNLLKNDKEITSEN